MNSVIFRDASAKKDFFGTSVLTSEEKETVNGVEHFVIHLDVSSASHPFFTGKQNMVDTSGRVDRFNRMMKKNA